MTPREPLSAVLRRMSTTKLQALVRVAKDPKKGVRPFFVDPKTMQVLRRELEGRNDTASVDKTNKTD